MYFSSTHVPSPLSFALSEDTVDGVKDYCFFVRKAFSLNFTFREVGLSHPMLKPIQGSPMCIRHSACREYFFSSFQSIS